MSLDIHIYYTHIGHINKYIHCENLYMAYGDPIQTLINYIPFLPVSEEFPQPQVPDSELLPTSPKPREKSMGNAGGASTASLLRSGVCVLGCLRPAVFCRGWPNMET